MHVSYLSRGLDEIGYHTTLVAGRVARDEGSMEAIAEDAGVHPVYLPELQREIAPVLDVAAVRTLLALIRELRPHVLHDPYRRQGRHDWPSRSLSWPVVPAVPRSSESTPFHGHVLRGYFLAGTHLGDVLEGGLDTVWVERMTR